MLYEEWKNLMHLSVDDNGKSGDIDKRRADLSAVFSSTINDVDREYKAIYALQTTYAIIVKLIACKVLDRLNYNAEADVYHDLLSLDSGKMRSFSREWKTGILILIWAFATFWREISFLGMLMKLSGETSFMMRC